MSEADATVETRIKLKKPAHYKVLILNDDFTPMEFVIEILVHLFGKSVAEAHQLTLAVHRDGKGLAGVYSKEVALQKVSDVAKRSKHNGHPLRAVAEIE